MISETLTRPESPRTKRALGPDSVLAALRKIHAELEVGDLFPSQRDLVRRLDASERSVMWALGELQREGWIVRHHGKGTFVAPVHVAAPLSRSAHQANGASPRAHASLGNRTVVGIALWNDDGATEPSVNSLFPYAQAAGLSFMTQFVEAEATLDPEPFAHLNPAGFVLFNRDLAGLGQDLMKAGFRAVQIGAPTPGGPARLVVRLQRPRTGQFSAAKHLVDLGHRRLAMVGAELPGTPWWRGGQRAIQEAGRSGIAVELSSVALPTFAQWMQDPGQAAKFLATSATTGFVLWNDMEALKLIGILGRLNLQVPSDISVVGYDNSPMGTMRLPALTTVDCGIGQQLSTALDLLLRPEPPVGVNAVAIPTLIPRESTASPKR